MKGVNCEIRRKKQDYRQSDLGADGRHHVAGEIRGDRADHDVFVLTSESVADMGLKVGDEVELIVKAIHVLPVKP